MRRVPARTVRVSPEYCSSRDAVIILGHCLQHFLAFFKRKARRFGKVNADSDYNLIKESESRDTIYQIHVTIGHGIEAGRKNSNLA